LYKQLLLVNFMQECVYVLVLRVLGYDAIYWAWRLTLLKF
jgi:hypothetical protein